MNLLRFKLICLVLFSLSLEINGHGMLHNPPARTTAWRYDSSFPAEYTDNQMFCGGASTQWGKNKGKCGICGEDYSVPKLWERGGRNYLGKSVRTYNQGQTIDVYVQLTAEHLGYFEFRICNVDGWNTEATQECLDKTVLKDQSGNSKFYVNLSFKYYYKLVLPAGLKCKHCVFQWKYNCGNSWGTDPVTGQSGLGFGEQEQFYGCADVTITEQQITNKPVTNKPVTNKPVTNKPITNKPVTNKPITNKPVTNKPITNKPITNKPVTNKPITNKPVTENPNVTQEKNNSEFQCKTDGMFASKDCKGFYQCVHSNTPHAVKVFQSCPYGLLFDNKAQACNYPYNVIC